MSDILATDFELNLTAETVSVPFGWRWQVRRDVWDGQRMVRTIIARGPVQWTFTTCNHDGRNAFRQIVAAERATQPPPLEQVADAIWAKNRPQVIQAIKDLRAQPPGISLKEAKDAIDAARQRAGDA